MRSRLGYLFRGFLVGFACLVAGIARSTSAAAMDGMPRAAMPGRAELLVPAGQSTLYVEHHSHLDDREYEAPDELVVHCEARGMAGVVLTPAATPARYDQGGYAGRAAFDLTASAGGRVAVECDGAQPYVIAVGQGIGAWRVIALLAILPAAIGVGLLAVTFVRRRRVRS
jgi:hypothetical protein